MKLDESDRILMANALHVAAEVYERDAALMATHHGETHSLTTQFRVQASAAQRLSETIENCDTVEIGYGR